MSGAPNREQVNVAHNALAVVARNDAEMSMLRAEIDRMQKRLADLSENSSHARNSVLELMRKMDVAQSGNTGYEARMLSFLLMLTEPVSKAPPPLPPPIPPRVPHG